MGLFSKKKDIEVYKDTQEVRSYSNPFSFRYGSGSTYKISKAMQLSVVYRCVNVISDAVALMPLEVYSVDDKGFVNKEINHPLYDMLAFEPNYNMSRVTFFKTIITKLLLKGDAFIEIYRDNKNNVTKLNLLRNEEVVVNINAIDGSIYYEVLGRFVDAGNMIHILNYSEDGIIGVSTLTNAFNSLEIANNTESHAKGFFKGGANMAGIISTNANMTAEQQLAFQSSLANAYNSDTGKPNGLAILPSGMTYQSTTVNPKDAQMLESRQYNVIDICRFFGVSPTKVFDMSAATFNNVETMQLAFLTDTISPLLEKIELEFHRKLFLKSERYRYELKFDIQRLLRVDMESRSNYYTKMFQMGCYSTNEMRKEIGMPPVENGDKIYISQNLKDINETINKDTNIVNDK